MIIGIFTILGVLLGFYLGRFQEINKNIGDKIPEFKKMFNKPKPYGEPFVVMTNEAELEVEQKKEEKEIINLEDFNK